VLNQQGDGPVVLASRNVTAKSRQKTGQDIDDEGKNSMQHKLSSKKTHQVNHHRVGIVPE
jgi:hypothetical protein